MPLEDTAPTKRELQRLETRELLFKLALDEFRRVGVGKARIRAIVEAAGVVPGTFYFHFPTKDHVLFEYWRRNSQRTVELLPEPDSADVPSFVRALGDAVLAVEEEIADPRLVRAGNRMLLDPPEGVDLSDNAIADLAVEFFSLAAAKGALRGELGPDEIARLVLTSLFGTLLVASDEPAERRRDVHRTLDFFVGALASG